MAELYPIMDEVLKNGGEVTFTPSGISMMPMLHNRTDEVVLESPRFPLKKYDLPLYRRDNGVFILHRVVDVSPDGTYVMSGDNQWQREYGIRDDNIIGVVKSFKRNGKKYSCTDKSYMRYCRFWDFIYPLRKFVMRATAFTIRRLLRLKKSLARVLHRGENERQRNA